MLLRKLDSNGDMQFGNGNANFYKDQADAVAQNVYTRLKLWRSEWYLDTDEGTDWLGKCLGKNTIDSALLEIKQRILNTDGVESIVNLSASIEPSTRKLSAQGTISTTYGSVDINYSDSFESIGDE